MKKNTAEPKRKKNTEEDSEVQEIKNARIIFRCTPQERKDLESYLSKNKLNITQHCRNTVLSPVYPTN